MRIRVQPQTSSRISIHAGNKFNGDPEQDPDPGKKFGRDGSNRIRIRTPNRRENPIGRKNRWGGEGRRQKSGKGGKKEDKTNEQWQREKKLRVHMQTNIGFAFERTDTVVPCSKKQEGNLTTSDT
jgi:hypothetical protein